ncbi:hypothetical protein LSCM1_04526 [Leishmania martiniquensis]|uniref:Mitochondrial import inner membrane translocase subunit TIM50 n=1 Tax=Leishmania martiniquensis TaxID=1580590 RepID=A0A836HA54_9TRYP|nr:hypothetical protein LSCM1_04526 [Leishmania martiniquensis]
MRLSTSSQRRRNAKELNANTSSSDLRCRGGLQATTPFLSARYKSLGDQLLMASESPLSSLENDLACVAVGHAVPSRFRTTVAAYGTQAGSHSGVSKAPMQFMWPGQRSTLAHEALSDFLGTDSHAGRDRYPIKGIRTASANPSGLLIATGPVPVLGKCKDTAQDAAFPAAPRLDTGAVCDTLLKSRRTESTEAATLSYSPPVTLSSTLIPPPRPQDVGKLVIVLDLDETLVHSRDTTVFKRPGVAQLLKTLKGKCEVIVWTAGTREYALNVIRMIDTVCAVQHCIYRHPLWWTGDVGCTKDLRLLGRPMDRVLLVDNTPSVFRANPRNSLLVEDFIVPHLGGYSAQEKTLSVLADIFEHVFRRFTSPCVADVLASKRISRQVIRLERGACVELNVLTTG